MKNNKKTLKATWSDESEESQVDDEEDLESLTSHYIRFLAIFSSRNKSVANSVATSYTTSEDVDKNCEEISEKDLLLGYELMLKRFDQMILPYKLNVLKKRKKVYKRS